MSKLVTATYGHRKVVYYFGFFDFTETKPHSASEFYIINICFKIGVVTKFTSLIKFNQESTKFMFSKTGKLFWINPTNFFFLMLI